MKLSTKITSIFAGSLIAATCITAVAVPNDPLHNEKKAYENSFAFTSNITPDDFLNTVDLAEQAVKRNEIHQAALAAEAARVAAEQKIAEEKAAAEKALVEKQEAEAAEAARVAELAEIEKAAANKAAATLAPVAAPAPVKAPVRAVTPAPAVVPKPTPVAAPPVPTGPRIDYILRTAGPGNQDTINACIGAVDVTNVMYRGQRPVLAEHWHCGGANFPTWAGATVQINGYGIYRVNGIAAVLDKNIHKTDSVPQGHELFYQTCLNNNLHTMAFVSLSKIG